MRLRRTLACATGYCAKHLGCATWLQVGCVPKTTPNIPNARAAYASCGPPQSRETAAETSELSGGEEAGRRRVCMQGEDRREEVCGAIGLSGLCGEQRPRVTQANEGCAVG
jgi:hypothetical protein